jgi:hypothetical protein
MVLEDTPFADALKSDHISDSGLYLADFEEYTAY